MAHLGCKIFLLLLDARADLVAHDRGHLAAGLLQVLLDRLLVVLDERLAEQRDLAEPLADLALDDLGDDLLRLAGGLRVVLRLLDENLALAAPPRRPALRADDTNAGLIAATCIAMSFATASSPLFIATSAPMRVPCR